MSEGLLRFPDVVDLDGFGEYLALKAAGRIIVTDYPVKSRPRDFRANGAAARFEAIFDKFDSNTRRALAAMRANAEALARVPFNQPKCTRSPYWSNGFIPPLDGLSLYAMVSMNRPRLYVEVGSGNSTKFVRRAIEDLGLSTRIVSIDPHPRAEIDALCDEVIRQPMEDVAPEVFGRLGRDDMLFVDNSHMACAGSDVAVFFTEVLPALASGVVYGLHDMPLPLDYDERMAPRGYNEHYLMAAYLLGGAAGDHVAFPSAHVAWREDLCGLAPFPEHPGMLAEGRHGGALWMRKA
ncbi:class I SAM-dependent methyltransferase [Caulobacter sp. DWR2-3-1b2]|uniref:class I SAM-dependent methyltransferase n=1 Tax=unclassified Caulobacter TaxID=2648921 RepID=UPI003CE6C4FB